MWCSCTLYNFIQHILFTLCFAFCKTVSQHHVVTWLDGCVGQWQNREAWNCTVKYTPLHILPVNQCAHISYKALRLLYSEVLEQIKLERDVNMCVFLRER
ncbi:hypothetical protein CHARACLAT_020978 [Characodon lateralis]|uniref:Secreted protein n=1 Tax=Characodon lateralis TaxID=208331 RepID=A0ABU7DIG1_9TELE|nr:hypothetical protein [Characodon lateralis]